MTAAQREILRGYLDHSGDSYKILSVEYPAGLDQPGNRLDCLKIVSRMWDTNTASWWKYVDYFDADGATAQTRSEEELTVPVQ